MKHHFDITPDEILTRMTNYWLEGIDKGIPQVVTGLLPFLEMRAVDLLEAELDILKCEPPDRIKVLNPLESWWASEPGTDMRTVEEIEREHDAKRFEQTEKWRLWWLNEAYQNCDIHSPISRAGNHLSLAGQAAVNVLIIGSELREAIELNKSEKAAALGVMLMSEVMLGGLFTAYEKAHAAQQRQRANFVPSEAREMASLKRTAIRFAQDQWKADTNKKIGEVAADFIQKAAAPAKQKLGLDEMPKLATVKMWLRATPGIPKAAQKKGRPQKTTDLL
jgi:hypothetical protein